MNFNRYFTNQELADLLKEWSQEYSEILQLGSLGTSHEGRDIPLLTITNQKSGVDTDKPAIWLDANIHATEIAGTTTTLRIAWELLSEYGQSDRIDRLVDSSAFYIVPRLNPDGAALAMSSSPRYIRSGTRHYPYEDRAEGLHEADIDGDGRLLQMRLRDPHGDWKISSLNSRLMEKRKPDEVEGEFYRLLPEGLLEDFDGYRIKIAPALEGLDFNRNYPAEWRPENEQRGAGPYPASEPEIRAAVQFLTHHPNINTAIAYHTYSGVILRPYGTRPDEEIDVNDLWTFQAIANRAEELTGYRTVSVYHDFKYHPKRVITGPSNDWVYDHLGMLGYVIELWDIVGRAGITERKYIDWMRDHPHEDDLKIFEWTLQNAGEGGYVDWYEFQHPQLGTVELGGYDRMFTWRNPPLHFMGEEAERNVPYVLALAEMLPRLTLHALNVNAIGDGKYHVEAVIDNSGFLPTYTTNQGKNRSAMRPVRAELTLPEQVVIIQGQRRTEVGHLEGRSNKTSLFAFGAAGTDHRGRVEWVLQAAAGTEIGLDILSDRAGSLHLKMVLE